MTNLPLLILCAGFGKRMLNLTINSPKPLLVIDNITLLKNTIYFFKMVGFKEFLINTHYLHHKFEEYLYNDLNDIEISLIYEPKILGTGGAVKNIFNYTNNKKLCVVNSDIFWQNRNLSDIKNFLINSHETTHCKILLSKNINFLGLKKNKGDFCINNGIISNYNDKSEVIFFSGFQIVAKNIFNNTNKIFSMNEIWRNLITNKNLKGQLTKSKILHIGDKKTFEDA